MRYRTRVAQHEAAHAAVARYFGIRVYDIQVTGHGISTSGTTRTGRTRYPQTQAKISIAGYVWERHFCPDRKRMFAVTWGAALADICSAHLSALKAGRTLHGIKREVRGILRARQGDVRYAAARL
jgi:hypothetical protein